MLLHLFVAHAEGTGLLEAKLYEAVSLKFDGGRPQSRVLVAEGQLHQIISGDDVRPTDQPAGRLRSFLGDADRWRTI